MEILVSDSLEVTAQTPFVPEASLSHAFPAPPPHCGEIAYHPQAPYQRATPINTSGQRSDWGKAEGGRTKGIRKKRDREKEKGREAGKRKQTTTGAAQLRKGKAAGAPGPGWQSPRGQGPENRLASRRGLKECRERCCKSQARERQEALSNLQQQLTLNI